MSLVAGTTAVSVKAIIVRIAAEAAIATATTIYKNKRKEN